MQQTWIQNIRKKLLFIYNPYSGMKLIAKKLAEIVDLFTKGGYDVICHPTQSKGDCMEFIKERHAEFDLIVVSGGDGTLNEAVNGMMNGGCKNEFGYIPTGSTNDFSHSVGIPSQAVKAASAIMSGKAFECDIGRLNDRYFTYVAAFGTLAQVSYSTPQNVKNVLGFAAYILEGIAALSTIESFNLSFTSEEHSGSGEYILGLVTNSLYVGGFSSILSDSVVLNDGLFEVLLVKKPKNAAQLQAIASSVLKREFDQRYIDCFKTKKITIASDKPLSWTLDGENGGAHSVSVIENFEKALKIIKPDVSEN